MNYEELSVNDVYHAHQIALHYQNAEYDRLKNRLVAYNSIYTQLTLEELATEGQVIYDTMKKITTSLDEKSSLINLLSSITENLEVRSVG